MFKSVHPVCPVVSMATSLEFWRRLGFEVGFSNASRQDRATYVGIRRGNLELHLQTFSAEQRTFTQTMAIRVEMTDRSSVEALHREWAAHGIISAALADTPWGTHEFGFYDLDGTPFFFYADQR